MFTSVDLIYLDSDFIWFICVSYLSKQQFEQFIMRDEHRLWTRCPFCHLIMNKQQKAHLRKCGKEHGKSIETINQKIRDDGYDFTKNQSIPLVTAQKAQRPR